MTTNYEYNLGKDATLMAEQQQKESRGMYRGKIMKKDVKEGQGTTDVY